MASLSIGDRNLPLEADLGEDFDRKHELVGRLVEVSKIAGGDLFDLRGENAEISGVLLRLGRVSGYEVKIKGKTYSGSSKDFFVDRDVLEDIQPPTPTSVAVQEALTHWSGQRDYWHERTDGLENLCFELASATPSAIPLCHPWGWQFLIPDPMPSRHTVVECHSAQHGNFWTLSVMVYPKDSEVPRDLLLSSLLKQNRARIADHWDRTFTWAELITKGMIEHGYPWGECLKSIQTRKTATSRILSPLVDRALGRALSAVEELRSKPARAGILSVGFSDIRLKAGTTGLTEPPSDRRPYTVMSVSPRAARKPEYLEQVVLHEGCHIAVTSTFSTPPQ